MRIGFLTVLLLLVSSTVCEAGCGLFGRFRERRQGGQSAQSCAPAAQACAPSTAPTVTGSVILSAPPVGVGACQSAAADSCGAAGACAPAGRIGFFRRR